MDTIITIFREVRDPRDINARHDLAAMLVIALMATVCGAKSCLAIADCTAANEEDLAAMDGAKVDEREVEYDRPRREAAVPRGEDRRDDGNQERPPPGFAAQGPSQRRSQSSRNGPPWTSSSRPFSS